MAHICTFFIIVWILRFDSGSNIHKTYSSTDTFAREKLVDGLPAKGEKRQKEKYSPVHHMGSGIKKGGRLCNSRLALTVSIGISRLLTLFPYKNEEPC
jgi:hypothetical protein